MLNLEVPLYGIEDDAFELSDACGEGSEFSSPFGSSSLVSTCKTCFAIQESLCDMLGFPGLLFYLAREKQAGTQDLLDVESTEQQGRREEHRANFWIVFFEGAYSVEAVEVGGSRDHVQLGPGDVRVERKADPGELRKLTVCPVHQKTACWRDQRAGRYRLPGSAVPPPR